MITHHKKHNLPFLNQDHLLSQYQFLGNIVFLSQASMPPCVLDLSILVNHWDQMINSEIEFGQYIVVLLRLDVQVLIDLFQKMLKITLK